MTPIFDRLKLDVHRYDEGGFETYENESLVEVLVTTQWTNNRMHVRAGNGL